MAEQAIFHRPPRFLAGLDVGRQNDWTALCVIEREMRLGRDGRFQPWYFCGHLERIPLKTPYPVMVQGVRKRLERIGERCMLVIDGTGVGLAIVDMFRAGWQYYDADLRELRTLEGKPSIIDVRITAGETAKSERWDEWHVAKLLLIMTFMVVLQQQRIDVAQDLPLWPSLLKEAQAFAFEKKTMQQDDPYQSWRNEDGEHDDLLLAVACAIWAGERWAPMTLPTHGKTTHAIPAGNPLKTPMRRRAA